MNATDRREGSVVKCVVLCLVGCLRGRLARLGSSSTSDVAVDKPHRTPSRKTAPLETLGGNSAQKGCYQPYCVIFEVQSNYMEIHVHSTLAHIGKKERVIPTQTPYEAKGQNIHIKLSLRDTQVPSLENWRGACTSFDPCTYVLTCGTSLSISSEMLVALKLSVAWDTLWPRFLPSCCHTHKRVLTHSTYNKAKVNLQIRICPCCLPCPTECIQSTTRHIYCHTCKS